MHTDDDDLGPLIEEYVSCARECLLTNYESRVSVRAGNRAADRLRSIAKAIAARGPRATEGFSLLLSDPDAPQASWAAHHLLELMNPDESQEERALAIITALAEGQTAYALGTRMWLENWRRTRNTKG